MKKILKAGILLIFLFMGIALVLPENKKANASGSTYTCTYSDDGDAKWCWYQLGTECTSVYQCPWPEEQ